MLLDFPP